MNKIFKIGCLSIIVVVAVFVVGSLITFSIPSLDENALASILKNKAAVRVIVSDIEITCFESSGPTFMHSDYAETYVVKLSPEVHSQILSGISEQSESRWKRLSSAYQLSLFDRAVSDTSFIFLIYSDENKMHIQIIED